MIVYKNGKITAIDKKTLKELNVTFENFSKIISLIEIEIASIENSIISIKHKKYKIENIDIISLEDIKIFKCIPIENIEKTEHSFEFNIKNNIETIPQFNKEPEIIENEPSVISSNTESFFQNETSTDEFPLYNIPSEETFELKLPQNNTDNTDKINLYTKHENNNFENIEPTTQNAESSENINIQNNLDIKTEENNNIISISFEDEFSEIENMLNLSSEEAKKEITKELEKAADDLSIDIDTIYELKDELFEMIHNEKDNFFKAIHENNYNMLHETAHKLKGAALNLRLSNLALILKKIDELSKKRTDTHKIQYLVEKFYQFIDKIQTIDKKMKIPKEIKNLILNTIQDYLDTQNEKKFQKDKKYIEKLLNVKINSIQDLEKILKG